MQVYETGDGNINKLFEEISSASIFVEGKENILDAVELSKLKEQLYDAFYNSRIMPAYGVSLDSETRKAMNTGKWLRMDFDEKKEVNGLPFTSLVIYLERGYGTNLIREYDGKLDGRCIYIDFDDLTELDNITSVIEK